MRSRVGRANEGRVVVGVGPVEVGAQEVEVKVGIVEVGAQEVEVEVGIVEVGAGDVTDEGPDVVGACDVGVASEGPLGMTIGAAGEGPLGGGRAPLAVAGAAACVAARVRWRVTA